MNGLDLLGIAGLIGLFGVWRRAIWNLARFPERVYRAPSMLAAALTTWRGLGMLVLALLLALPGFSQVGWDAFGAAALPLKLVALAAAAAMTWQYATYARNYHLGRTHLADRLILVALAALIAVHPMAIAMFVPVVITIIRQFDHPSCFNYSWTQTLLPFDALGVIAASIPCVATGVVEPSTAIIALGGVFAAEYVIAGLAKLRLPVGPAWWIFKNRFGNLLMTSAANGFLSGVDESKLARGALILNKLSILMALGTLAIELGAGLLLVDRTLAMVLIAGCLVLHTAIVLSSGVFFWKWMIVDVGMLGAIMLAPAEVFGLWPFLVTTGMVILSPWVCRPSWLGWTDTGFSNSFRFEAVTTDGERLEIPRRAFEPFDVAFSQSRFFFLCKRPWLVGTFGANTRFDDDARTLTQDLMKSEGNPDLIEAIRSKAGRRTFRADAANELVNLVRRRIATFHEPTSWRRLMPPKHLLVGPRMKAYAGEPIERIDIRFVETFFDGSGNRVITDDVVSSTPLDQRAAATDAA